MASWSQLSLFWLLVEAGEPAHARFLALPLLLEAKKTQKKNQEYWKMSPEVFTVLAGRRSLSGCLETSSEE